MSNKSTVGDAQVNEETLKGVNVLVGAEQA